MGVAMEKHILQVVDWKKYTLDEWLEQLGAWIESNRMCGGGLPDNLGINMLWEAMRSTGVVKIPSARIKATCQISDDEARAVQRLLMDTMSGAEYHFKFGIICLLKHKVENKSVRLVGEETGQAKSQAAFMIGVGRSFICGRHSYLKSGIDRHDD